MKMMFLTVNEYRIQTYVTDLLGSMNKGVQGRMLQNSCENLEDASENLYEAYWEIVYS